VDRAEAGGAAVSESEAMARQLGAICRFGKRRRHVTHPRDFYRPIASLLETVLVGLSLRYLRPTVLDPFIEPGALVRHSEREDWGLGQVQTVVGHRVTVNFEHAGKQLIDTSRVRLVFVSVDPRE
jgi:hypothetical protein